MRNNGVSKIVGIGDICLETSVGNKLVLKDVIHVLVICLNLISTCKLDDERFTNSFGESKWKLTKGSFVVARGKKQNTLYVVRPEKFSISGKMAKILISVKNRKFIL